MCFFLCNKKKILIVDFIFIKLSIQQPFSIEQKKKYNSSPFFFKLNLFYSLFKKLLIKNKKQLKTIKKIFNKTKNKNK